ncbi:MAG: cupin, partial [Deltaproteobacteria bacterium]|nr:cupin [Deltaproteobacteria bacterium]
NTRKEGRQTIILKPGDSYHIPPLLKHRMKALEESEVIEISTPELNDVIRLEDDYGRVKT